MAPRKWSGDEKQRALGLYVEHGPAEASRQTGIPQGTIKSWASRLDLQQQQQDTTRRNTRAAVERRKRSLEERRAVLTEKLGELAELGVDWALEALADPDRDVSVRDAIGAWTRAIHDLQLLSGAATSRPDWSSADPEERRARIIELTSQLEQRARRAAAAAAERPAGDGLDGDGQAAAG